MLVTVLVEGASAQVCAFGNAPRASSHVTDYMKQTSGAGKDMVKKVDDVLKKVSRIVSFPSGMQNSGTKSKSSMGLPV